MATAIDTKVLIALWDEDTRMNTVARQAFGAAHAQGSLVASGVVYAELLALPGRSEMMLDAFFDATRIKVDHLLTLDRRLYRAAFPELDIIFV